MLLCARKINTDAPAGDTWVPRWLGDVAQPSRPENSASGTSGEAAEAATVSSVSTTTNHQSSRRGAAWHGIQGFQCKSNCQAEPQSLVSRNKKKLNWWTHLQEKGTMLSHFSKIQKA